MFQRIWQWLKQLWQRWVARQPPPAPTRQPPSDAESESVFMQLLQEVASGSTRGEIHASLIIQQGKTHVTEADLVAWLRRASSSWLTSPAQHQELGRRMGRLGDIYKGEIAEVARDISRKLVVENKPSVQYPSVTQKHPTTELNLEAAIELSNESAILYNLELYQQAIDKCNQAINLNSEWYGAYINRGLALNALGLYEAAIEDYNRAINLNSKCDNAYNNRGNSRKSLGRYQEAIDDYNQAINLNPNYYYPYNNRGNALSELGRYLEAIADYTKGIDLNAQYYEAYNNRGLVKAKLAQYQEAIKDYDCAIKIKPDYWRPWDFRGLAILSLEGYDAAIKNWRDGIIELEKYSPVDFRGCGELYRRIGSEQFLHGNHQENPFPDWRAAKASYYKSLENLDRTQSRERYLEFLREYIKVCRALGEDKQEVDELVRQGTDHLERLIKDGNVEADQLRLDRKFASFIQYRVDSLVAENKILDAFSLAEERRNTSLRWLRYGYSNFEHQPSDFNSLLTHSGAAAIYWHVSYAAITTFILRFSETPDIFPPSTTSIDAYQQMLKFETWLKEWKTDYQNYCETLKTEGTEKKSEAPIFKQNLGDLPSPENHPWRAKMPERLNQLAEILHIPQVLTAVGNNITQIILIPHRDLHLLPLESLFYQTLEAKGNLPAITRLPSAQIGINLQPLQLTAEKHLLNVETPSPILFAEIESAVIDQLYHPHLTTIPNYSATKQQITAAITAGTNCFHFTGHGYHNLDSPSESALILANKEQLTVQEIFNLNFQGYHLVSLSACETGITSKKDISDEYVGLVSGFLAVGVARVVSTLWTVEEISAALMMIKFHQLFKDGIPPAEALQQAQYWLRSITYAKLAEWYLQNAAIVASFNRNCSRDLEDEAERIQGDRAKMESTKPPYAHPYYWAGFTVTGKANY